MLLRPSYPHKEDDIMSTERDEKHKSFLPTAPGSTSTLLLGSPGTGKTTTLEHLALRDIENGDGVAILDPWGDLSERILDLVPEDRMDDVIYFELGNPDFCPLWNPLKNVQGINDIWLKADAIVEVINADDRFNCKQDHLLRQCILGILHLDNPTLSDIPRCLNASDDAGRQFREHILKAIRSEKLREFWQHGIMKYNSHDFARISRQFTRLLLCDTTALMLSQPEQRFDFEKILDENKIFVANLSPVSMNTRVVLGSLITNAIYATARTRGNEPPEQCKSFHLYADDLRHLGSGIHDLLAEGRRYRVSLTLAHQSLAQMEPRLASDALVAAGLIIVLQVQQADAIRLGELLETQPRDLTSLKRGEAITRAGTEVRHITVPPPRVVPDISQRDRIIQISRQRYYRPTEEVRASITG
jgi:hypothetical protein